MPMWNREGLRGAMGGPVGPWKWSCLELGSELEFELVNDDG